MSDAITPQSGQSVPFSVYSDAQRDMLKYKGKLRQANAQLAALTTERDEARASLTALTTERDALAGKLTAAPSEQQAKIDELTTQLRTIRHRSVFDRIAKGHKVRDDAMGDLWDALKYTPDADEADEAGLAERVAGALKGRGYMLQADPQPGGGAADAATGANPGLGRGPGPGLARGGAPPTPPSDRAVAAVEGLRAATGRSDPFRIA